MTSIDGVILKRMIVSGSNNLYNCYPEIDALNVFPVPDGDTGTNMNLTMNSGAKEVFNKTDASVSVVAKDFARGLLMGARGNSGVILSQIFRGFSEGLSGKESVDAIGLAEAFMKGKEVAYNAVMRPVEGTILTVIREASAALYEKAEKNMPIDVALDIIYEEAKKSLDRTPDLLPVLKEVGVVDSGGAGLVKVLEGFAKALHNDIVEKNMPTVTDSSETYSTGKPEIAEPGRVQAKFEHAEFGYCTQFLLQLSDQDKLPEDKKIFNEKRFKAVLEAHGNSIVYAKVEDLVKVHVHTLKPGNILTYAQQFGEFKLIKVDNMAEQHEEIMLEDKEMKKEAGFEEGEEKKLEVKTASAPTLPEKKEEKKKFALVTVAVGDGIEELFRELNVDYIVSGGQTMNPSTQDFVSAIRSLNAEDVFLLPNNGNIYMAAKQAGELMEEEGVHCHIIPTKTIPEGLVACMVFNPETTADDNENNMMENVEGVKSGEVTYAIKDTTIDGVTVEKDKYMGIAQKKILGCHKHKTNALYEMIDHLVDEDSSIITVIYGQDVNEEEAKKVEDDLNEKYGDDLDIDVKYGGQPVYSFFVSVE